MSVTSLSQDLHGFAIELRKLAYTMPGGVEDPLIRLSERMVRHAQRQIDQNQSRSIDLRAPILPSQPAGGDDASVVHVKTRPALRQKSHRDNADIGPLAGGSR